MKSMLFIAFSFLAQGVAADNFKSEIAKLVNQTKGVWAVDAQSLSGERRVKVYHEKADRSFGCVTSISELDNYNQTSHIRKKIAFSTMECKISGTRNFTVEATQAKKSPSAIDIFEKVFYKKMICISAEECGLASEIDVKNLLGIIVNRKGTYLELSGGRAEILRVYLDDDLNIVKIYLDRM